MQNLPWVGKMRVAFPWQVGVGITVLIQVVSGCGSVSRPGSVVHFVQVDSIPVWFETDSIKAIAAKQVRFQGADLMTLEFIRQHQKDLEPQRQSWNEDATLLGWIDEDTTRITPRMALVGLEFSDNKQIRKWSIMQLWRNDADSEWRLDVSYHPSRRALKTYAHRPTRNDLAAFVEEYGIAGGYVVTAHKWFEQE